MWTLYVMFITFSGDVNVVSHNYPSLEACHQMTIEIKEQSETSAIIWRLAAGCVHTSETKVEFKDQFNESTDTETIE